MTSMLIILAVVAVVALLVKAMSGSSEESAADSTAPREPSSATVLDDVDDVAEDLDDDFEEGQMVHAVAITSEGVAFVPNSHGLELIPPGEDDEQLREVAERHGRSSLAQAAASAPRNPSTGRLIVQWRPGQSLNAGDVVAVRVVRGAPGVDPWRVECLGRDRDYRPFPFETEEAARTAAELIEARILRPPRDEDGEPIPVGAEDFMVARREYEETEAALALEDDPGDEGDGAAPR